MDYKEALKLDPNNDKIKEDYQSCEAIVYKKSQEGNDSNDDDD